MKTDLLELVQTTLRRMNSDEVTSVSGTGSTEEARQVALICRHVYEELEIVRNWGHKTNLAKLEADDTDEFTVLDIPASVARIHEIWYKYDNGLGDGSTCSKIVPYACPSDFLEKVKCKDTGATNLSEITVIGVEGDRDPQSFTFDVINDAPPSCWTSFSDEQIVFDSYDSTIDALGIVGSSVTMLVQSLHVFDETDDLQVIEIPSEDWPLYRNMVLSRCYTDIKQAPNNAAEAVVRRLMIRAQRSSNHMTDRGNEGVNYGRS